MIASVVVYVISLNMKCRHLNLDSMGVASLVSVVLDIAFLLLLGLFWYRRIELTNALPLGFMFYLILGACVGLLPWSTYWIARWIVLNP